MHDKLLSQIDHVNILLQSKNQTIGVACSLINGLIRSIEDIRKIGFNNSLDEAKRTAKCLNISSELKDKRKIPRKYSCGADDEGTVSDDNSLKVRLHLSSNTNERKRMLPNECERIFATHSAATIYIVRSFVFNYLRFHKNLRS